MIKIYLVTVVVFLNSGFGKNTKNCCLTKVLWKWITLKKKTYFSLAGSVTLNNFTTT